MAQVIYLVNNSKLANLHCINYATGAGTAESIRKFSNRPIPFESNRTADSNSNLEASQVPNLRISRLRRLKAGQDHVQEEVLGLWEHSELVETVDQLTTGSQGSRL